MNETTITATRATTAPPYEKTAGTLLEACRMFYRTPENEAEFQEWMKSRKEGLDKCVPYGR